MDAGLNSQTGLRVECSFPRSCLVDRIVRPTEQRTPASNAGAQESDVGRSRHSKIKQLKCAAAALVLAVTVSLPDRAAAQAAIEFQIERGSLRDALTAYARITRRQLLYPSALVAGRTAPALRGRYNADEALNHLLEGSGIRFRRAGNAYVLIAPTRQATPPRPRPLRTPPPIVARPPAAQIAEPADEQAIVVTGTNIRGRTEGAAPVQVIGREDIERSGQGSVAEAIAALPQNFGGTGTEDTVLTASDRTIPNNGLGSSANLRALGSDATLTLINGRRVAGSGGKGDFTDLSLIPLAAVDRIEVLTDGASAIYGSDAVGGVVNVLLRRNFSGAETRLRVGTATEGDTQEVQLGQVFGARWNGGSLLAAYEFQRRDALHAGDRSFTSTADLRPSGGNDFRSFFSSPGTLVGPGPSGGLVPRFAIPRNQNGTGLRPADFLPGANLTSAIEGTDLLPRQTRHAGYLLLRQNLAPGVEAFAEGRYGHRRYFFAGPASTTVVQVTGSNPFFVSPDGAPFSLVAYSFIDELGPTENRGTVEAYSAAAGLTVELGDAWSADAYLAYARERTGVDQTNLINDTFLAEASGALPDNPNTPFSAARDGFFNPYGDGRVNSAVVLDFVGQGYTHDRINSGLLSANLTVGGTLFDLPGGEVRAALGASFRRESFVRNGESQLFGTAPTPAVAVDEARNVLAFFGEVTVPLFGPSNARPGLQRLELSAALRHERYDDFGASTNPRLGVIWEPVTGFRLRGSYGTSFRSPALRETTDPLAVSATQLRDNAGALNIVLFLGGGNPDLEPERATSWTFGAQLLPSAVPGLRAEATYFQTRFSNRIGTPAFEDLTVALRDGNLSPFVTPISPVTNPADRARVDMLRATPGASVPAFVSSEQFRFIIDGRYVNTAQVLVRGIDVLVSQRFGLFGGEASVAFNGSYLIDYRRQTTPVSPLIERVDTVGNPPDLRLRASANWDRGPFGATASLNYVDSYRDNVSVPPRSVSAWTTLDVQLRYRPQWGGWLRGLSFSLSIQNLFDSDPPFVNRTTGQAYDATNADPLGRFIAFQLIKSW